MGFSETAFRIDHGGIRMIRLLSFVGCIVFSGIVARGGIILDPASASGGFSTIGSADVSFSDGPRFSPLAPVPGISGLKVAGAADMVYVDGNSGGSLELDFDGQANGVISEPIIHTFLDFFITPNWSDPLFHLISFNLQISFDGTYIASASNFFGTDARPIHSQMTFDLDYTEWVGMPVNNFSVRFNVAPLDFGQVGDGISLVIPDDSLDIGVAGAATAVPEPGTWVILATCGLSVLYLRPWRVSKSKLTNVHGNGDSCFAE